MKVTMSFTIDYEVAKWVNDHSGQLRTAKSVIVNDILKKEKDLDESEE